MWNSKMKNGLPHFSRVEARPQKNAFHEVGPSKVIHTKFSFHEVDFKKVGRAHITRIKV